MTTVKRFTADLPSYLEGFFGKDTSDNYWYPKTGSNIPAVNISETNNEFLIEVAAPGFEKSDFVINIHNQVLTISSQKTGKDNNEDAKYRKREFVYASFERVFTLPETIEGEKIEASYVNGILKIAIPKREEAKVKPPKLIEIK